MHIETVHFDDNEKYSCTIFYRDEAEGYNCSGIKWRPMVVVLPGGAYAFTVSHEANPISEFFFGEGFNTAIIHYPSGKDAGYPAPQAYVSKALKYIRDNHEHFWTYPDKIAVCGFSAGGHLACSLGVHYDDPILQKMAGCQGKENRPDAMVLCYPVITTEKPYGSDGSIANLIQNIQDEETRNKYIEFFSLENYVNEETPPTFLFTTNDDVLNMNSIYMARECYRHHVPCEMHMYQEGAHGMAMGDFRSGQFPPHEGRDWTRQATRWLKETFQYGN